MQIVLDTYGLHVSVRNGCFHLTSEAIEKIISPRRVAGILITKTCRISSDALLLAAEHEIPIIILGKNGKVQARLWSGNFHAAATVRRQQVFFRESGASSLWVIDNLMHKIQMQALQVDYFIDRNKALQNSYLKIKQRLVNASHILSAIEKIDIDFIASRIMAYEAYASKQYWIAVSLYLAGAYKFDLRSRRPARDKFNALLNYNYAILYSMVETAIITTGLDPHFGFLHADRAGKSTLSFDIIEPFRPWADRMLINMCDSNTWQEQDFEPKENGWWLAKTGKHKLIRAYFEYWNEKAKMQNRITSRYNHILAQCSLLRERIQKTIIP